MGSVDGGGNGCYLDFGGPCTTSLNLSLSLFLASHFFPGSFAMLSLPLNVTHASFSNTNSLSHSLQPQTYPPSSFFSSFLSFALSQRAFLRDTVAVSCFYKRRPQSCTRKILYESSWRAVFPPNSLFLTLSIFFYIFPSLFSCLTPLLHSPSLFHQFSLSLQSSFRPDNRENSRLFKS